MGDRALVTTKDSGVVIYLHWNGTEAIDWIREAFEKGILRHDDEQYCAGRLTGYFHEQIPGDCSLGLFPLSAEEKKDPSTIEGHGDAGVIVLDCDTWEITCHDGYASERSGERIDLPKPETVDDED